MADTSDVLPKAECTHRLTPPSVPVPDAADAFHVQSVFPLKLRLWCAPAGFQNKCYYELKALNEAVLILMAFRKIPAVWVTCLQQASGFQDTSHLQGFLRSKSEGNHLLYWPLSSSRDGFVLMTWLSARRSYLVQRTAWRLPHYSYTHKGRTSFFESNLECMGACLWACWAHAISDFWKGTESVETIIKVIFRSLFIKCMHFKMHITQET